MLISEYTLPILPPRASTLAEEVDLLIWGMTLVTGVAGIGVVGALVYFCFRYHHVHQKGPTPRILGSHKLEFLWTIIPSIIFFVGYGFGAVVYDRAVHPPEDAPEIFVVGKQWMWKMQYPSGEREINELHLPVNKSVKITVTSEDVIHDFGIPAFRSKIDVLPGRYSTIWYHPTRVGTYHIFCDQYCGTDHSKMVGLVHVMEQGDYEAWLQGKAGENRKNSVDGSLAWEGRKLFLKLQCLACHSGDTQARAPVLAGLYKSRVPLQGGGTALADESYIRESILKPRAKIHEGWSPIMPTFQGQVSEEDLIKLIAYIKSLRVGDPMPSRTEYFPPPLGAPQEPSEGGIKR